jgi:RNA polymerase sigma-70 factor (ECF subfamily)
MAPSPSSAAATPPPDGPPDTELVERARKGDVAAYGDLVRRHQSRIYGLVHHMTGHREDAEDLVQDIFVKAYRSIHLFKGDSAFFTWLYRIALNRTINFLHQRKRRQGASLDDADQAIERDPAYVELSARESPFRDLTITELQQRLNGALQKLSDKHRTVVVMHDIEGVPHDEIARRLRVSSGTVRSRLFYARQLLQSELGDLAP